VKDLSAQAPGYTPPRSGGPNIKDVLRAEAAAGEVIPSVLLTDSFQDLGSDEIPIERYVSADFHRLEVERMWRRVWQMACREEEIPEAGDRIIYDIADYSIIVVRGTDGEIRGFHNSCLHRGKRLCDVDGHGPQLRCSFHGWRYGLDGRVELLPAEWDFAGLDKTELRLPECRVETWGGFVFVNLDPDAAPLRDYLEVLPEHFTAWPFENRVKVVHVAGVVPCNWKATQEAFMEGYHAWATHPTTAFSAADSDTNYDVYGDNVNRLMSLVGVQSSLYPEKVDERTIARAAAQDMGIGDPATIEVPDGSTARQVLAGLARKQLAAATGADTATTPTTDLIDLKQYFLFPNFFPWAGIGSPIGYRFRPNGNDHESCLVEVFIFAPVPPGVPRPTPAKVHRLSGLDWTEAPELGALGAVFNQDVANLVQLQRGLRSAAVTPGRRGIHLAEYQEVRVRHFHHTLSKYIDDGSH
jgi:phenylpropionate dioxygenase-like ring-hydroxylating dioxygenase large terminal subunit